MGQIEKHHFVRGGINLRKKSLYQFFLLFLFVLLNKVKILHFRGTSYFLRHSDNSNLKNKLASGTKCTKLAFWQDWLCYQSRANGLLIKQQIVQHQVSKYTAPFLSNFFIFFFFCQAIIEIYLKVNVCQGWNVREGRNFASLKQGDTIKFKAKLNVYLWSTH